MHVSWIASGMHVGSCDGDEWHEQRSAAASVLCYFYLFYIFIYLFLLTTFNNFFFISFLVCEAVNSSFFSLFHFIEMRQAVIFEWSFRGPQLTWLKALKSRRRRLSARSAAPCLKSTTLLTPQSWSHSFLFLFVFLLEAFTRIKIFFLSFFSRSDSKFSFFFLLFNNTQIFSHSTNRLPSE